MKFTPVTPPPLRFPTRKDFDDDGFDRWFAVIDSDGKTIALTWTKDHAELIIEAEGVRLTIVEVKLT